MDIRRFSSMVALFSLLNFFPTLGLAEDYWTVNVLTDTAVGDKNCTAASCSLRQAITAANDGGNDRVVLSNSGTYTLTNGELTVNSGMNIEGLSSDAASYVISGNSNRILNIGNSSSVTVYQVTLQNGSTNDTNGGAAVYIQVGSSLQVSDSVFKNNTVGDATTSRAGGAISNRGKLTVNQCTFEGNSASGKGGAIFSSGTTDAEGNPALQIYNSTFSGNSISLSDGNGASIAITSKADLKNVTINESSTRSAVFADGGTISFGNTIVANSGNGCAKVGASSALTSNGNNISKDNTCNFTATSDRVSTNPLLDTLATYSNIYGTQTFSLKPLSPARDAGNATICESVSNLDQRHISRPQGTACDIGAFEAAVVPTKLIVSGSTPATPVKGESFSLIVSAVDASGTPHGVYDDSTITLSVASGGNGGQLSGTLTKIMSKGTDTITFDGLSYNVANSQITIRAATSGLSNGTSNAIRISPIALSVSTPNHQDIYPGKTFEVTVTALDANGRPFNLPADATITLSKSSGTSSGTLSGTLQRTITSGTSSVIFSGLSYDAADGAVVLRATSSGMTSATGSSFSVRQHFAVTTLIDGNFGSCTATQCTLRDAINAANAAGSVGSIITLQNGQYTLSLGSLNINRLVNVAIQGQGRDETTIDGNNKNRVLFIDLGASADVSHLTIQHGRSDGTINPNNQNGGGILNFGSLNLRHCKVINNYTSGGGGGVQSGKYSISSLLVDDCDISNNTADVVGAGLQIMAGTATVNNSSISHNNAGWWGGGIANESSASTTITGTTVSSNAGIGRNNTQGAGGGIDSLGSLMLANSTVAGNTIVGTGSGIRLSSNSQIINSTISGANIAGDFAVAVAPGSSSATFTNTIISNISGAACFLGSGGTDISGGNNLATDNTCNFSKSGDLQGGNPRLAALTNNGGKTETMALETGSQAINRANAAVCRLPPINGEDQRGFRRASGSCDIGAYQTQ